MDDAGRYDAANDVIDWPISPSDFPVLTPNMQAAGRNYYEAFRSRQEGALRSALSTSASTPIIVLAKNDRGENVRVAVRPKSRAQAD